MKAEEFRKLLKIKGLNCTDAARILNLHRVTVRNWHCGYVKIPKTRVRQLLEMK